MNCAIALEARFVLNQGKPASHVFTYRFWQRYLEVFDSVTILGRLSGLEDASATAIEGPGVSLVPLPAYVGPMGFLRNFNQIEQIVRSVCSQDSVFIARVPGAIATVAIAELRRNSRPYVLEIVADPYDYCAPGAMQTPFRPFFRWLLPRQLRHQCSEAFAALYVTESALQRRYPPGSATFSTHCSDVDLPDSAFVSSPRSFAPKNSFTLIAIASLAQMAKGIDLLIPAVASCIRDGFDLKLVIVGDGKHRDELERLAATLGITHRVHFCGKLPAGDAVRTQLDRADVFVLPSYQEGLPRAMLEAMARGLPCIGSTVGGIPELLPAEDTIQPGDVTALVRKIKEVANHPERMRAMSERNWEKAKNYREERLNARRTEFYQSVKAALSVL